MGAHSGSRTIGNNRYRYPFVSNNLILHVDASNLNSYPGTGNTWFDISGNNVNGTLVNGAVFVNQKEGIIDFDGSNDHISFTNFNFDFTNGFSYFAFVKVDSTKSFARFMDFGLGQDNTNIIVYQNSTTQKLGLHTQIGAQSSNQWGQINSQQAVLAPSTSYFSIAATIAAGTPGTQSSAAALYKDGLVIPHDVQTRRPFVPSTTNRTSNFFGRSNWSTDAYFDGAIVLTMIYNRTLSAVEIKQNHDAFAGRF
jgi:hypothetical protein